MNEVKNKYYDQEKNLCACDKFQFLYDDFESERAARIAAETKLAELEDENRKLIRYGTFIFNRVNFSIGRAKSKIADKAVISCMQKITEISKARSES